MLAFIFGALAGFAAPLLVDPLARPLARLIQPVLPVEEKELTLLSLLVALLAASFLATILNSEISLWLMIGAVLGYFAVRIVAAIRAQIDKSSNSGSPD